MVSEFDEALQAWYRGSGGLHSRTAGLWPEPAPPQAARGPTLPYVTYIWTGGIPDDTMSSRGEDVVLAVRIRSAAESPVEVGEIYRLFRERFDHARIPVRGWTTVRMDRIGGGGRSRDADGGWVIPVTYRWKLDEGD